MIHDNTLAASIEIIVMAVVGTIFRKRRKTNPKQLVFFLILFTS
jgi:predicted membrane-bound mannosyltransferase